MLSFGYCLFLPHISWDDPEMVFSNTAVHEFDFKALFGKAYVGNFIPISMLLHALAWKLSGANDWGHHVLNLILHVFNGWMAFQLGQKLFRNTCIALSGAVFFLLHPLQVESVAWISELKNISYTTFFFAGLICYLRFREYRNLRNYLLVMMFFLLSVLSKPSAVVFPLCLVLIDFFLEPAMALKRIPEKSPFLLVAIVFGIVNLHTQQAAQFVNQAHAFPYYQRFALGAYAVFRYLMLFLLPFRLSVIYPFPKPDLMLVLSGTGAGLLIIFSLVFLLFRKNGKVFFILMFFLLNLALVLQWLPFGEVLNADRYMYLPLLGAGWGVGLLFSNLRLHPRILTGISILLALLSVLRMQAWKNATTLYNDVLRKFPDEFVALNSAGVEYMRLNDDEKALAYFDHSVRVAPRNYKAWYNRGLLWLKMGRPERAIADLDQALGKYAYRKAYTARASAHYMLREYSRALADAENALKMDGSDVNAMVVKGNCFNDINQLDSALYWYNHAAALRPPMADLYMKRAVVFGKRGLFRESLADLNQCVAMDAKHFEAWYWRAITKAKLGMPVCPDLQVAAINNFAPAVEAYNRNCR